MSEKKSNSRVGENRWYPALLTDIKSRIRSAQYEALRAVNKELVSLYWDLGQLIFERQKEAGWKRTTVENLAKDLQIEFPGIQGFSSRNLWKMRQFFETYCEDEKLAPLVRQIPWSHNLRILGGCKDTLQREFYIRMTK